MVHHSGRVSKCEIMRESPPTATHHSVMRISVKFHNWWNAPKTWAEVQAIDSVASHASWMENFPWTRLEKIKMPSEQKPEVDMNHLRQLNPKALRVYLKDGNWGGIYQRSDEEMMKIWRVAVQETLELLNNDWAK